MDHPVTIRSQTRAGGWILHRLWHLVVVVLLAGAFLPLATLIGLAVFAPAPAGGGPWGHILSTVLPEAGVTTLLLMLGVGLYVAVTGVATAWLVVMARFPGRGMLQWALILPLSIPTYIVAYTHAEVLDYTGPIQTALRALFGWTSARDYWFPPVRSLPSAVFVMGAVLYPYVYLSARTMFLTQSVSTLEAARTLGSRPWATFLRIALPMARPAVIAGVALALMETLNDIGAVEYFGVRTFTFAIYDTWLNRSDLRGATQIACVMMVLVLLLLQAERSSRNRQRFHESRQRPHAPAAYELHGWQAWAATAICTLPVILGFLMPVAVLLRYALRRTDAFLSSDLQHAALWTAGLAAMAALLTTAAGLLLAYATRSAFPRRAWLIARLASIGYAVPGAVLALGTLMTAAFLDNQINAALRAAFGIKPGLVMISTGAALIYAYGARFLSVSFSTLESGFMRIGGHVDMAARTLGRTALQTLVAVHLPMLRPTLMTAALLVFVEVTKELPGTLLLRPFGVETLATYVYVQASREAVGDAAPAALAIILVGMVPLLLMFGVIERRPRVRSGTMADTGAPA